MFSFWSSRKNNKSPGRTPTLPSQPSQTRQDVEVFRTPSITAHIPNLPSQADVNFPETVPAEATPEPVVTAVPNPHDAALSEVHAKMFQAEQLSTAAYLPRPTDPVSDSVPPRNPSPEPFFDPATGEQRGVFESVVIGSGDSEQLRDEVWTHLARIRQIQSEIAMMHRQMEGIGDESGGIDVEVDNDVDVDTVPTQEEEDAAKRAKEFDRLPGRFTGRSDNIHAMMTKLDDLSQAVTSFHALQPPPLSFDSAATSREATHSDTSAPPGSHAAPVDTIRTRVGIQPTTFSDPNDKLGQKPLHESPITAQNLFPPEISK